MPIALNWGTWNVAVADGIKMHWMVVVDACLSPVCVGDSDEWSRKEQAVWKCSYGNRRHAYTLQ
jgi:hypothetical protein